MLKLDFTIKQESMMKLKERIQDIQSEAARVTLAATNKQIKDLTKEEIARLEREKPRSKLASEFTTSGSVGGVVFKRKQSRGKDKGLFFLMSFYSGKQKQLDNQNVLNVNFRKVSNKEVNDLVRIVQTGAVIPVTERMRRAFGFTSTPLKKSTKSIVVPKREIEVVERNKSEIIEKVKESYRSYLNNV